MPSKINLLGQHFGKLIVLEETNQRKNKSVVWKCQCECGNIVYYSTKNLRSDGIISRRIRVRYSISATAVSLYTAR